jgi:hypothetical protein
MSPEIPLVRCLLCKRKLAPIGDGVFKHAKAADCLVRFADRWGVSIDEALAALEGREPEPDPEPIFSVEGMIIFPSVEEVCSEVFASAGLQRLGGQSSGRGWTSVSIYQRCPYAWKRRYIDDSRPFITGIEPPARAIGTLVHTFLAIYYSRMIIPDYPVTPESMYDGLMLKANPELVREGWRLFRAYALYYQHENIQPLAIEHDLKDPRTGESCRYDLIAFMPEDEVGSGVRRDGLIPGTYQLEHKTAGRFDDATLDGWANDGEVIGQMMLWERLGLDKRFGPIRGTIVNIIGKHKETARGGGPQFHRTLVAPASWQTAQHQRDLRSWEAQIKTSLASGHFPRARGGCINRYGKCDHWNHCATAEDD